MPFLCGGHWSLDVDLVRVCRRCLCIHKFHHFDPTEKCRDCPLFGRSVSAKGGGALVEGMSCLKLRFNNTRGM